MKASRWIGVAGCVALAGVLVFCGWLIPAHLRATDVLVLQRAGEGSDSLVAQGLKLGRAHQTEAARLLWQAARDEKMAGTEALGAALATETGNDALFPGGPIDARTNPVTDVIIRLENREQTLAYLETNALPVVRDLMRTRTLTNTVLFPPSSSSAGQAFDAAVSIGGLLLAGHHLTPGLAEAVAERTAAAQTQTDAQPLEEILMDLMSLGRRMTWSELVVFVKQVNDPSTLTTLAGLAREAGVQWPELYASVVLSQKPEPVATWMMDFSESGLSDLGTALRYGEGGVNELLQRHQRLARLPAREEWASKGPLAGVLRVLANCALQRPWLALLAKWCCFLSGGYLLGMAGHHVWRARAAGEETRAERGFHLARELLFALGFLLVLLLLSEPFLAQGNQKAQFAFHFRVPLTGAASASTLTIAKSKLMDPRSLITLLLFFVLQGLIYCACLFKLGEVKRQKLPARVILKLLENEEHLFDGGLYLGFAGTIICLILVSMGIIQQSLMAAYSSTSFGIIFVSAFKIFNLRPVRRRLLLEAETQAAAAPRSAAEPAPLATVV